MPLTLPPGSRPLTWPAMLRPDKGPVTAGVTATVKAPVPSAALPRCRVPAAQGVPAVRVGRAAALP